MPRHFAAFAAACAAAFTLAPLPASAELQRVTDRGTFLSIVQGRDLSRIGVSLNVAPNGAITGRGFGRSISGTWVWENGFFCRTLDAGDQQFDRNCQIVSVDGTTIRFHADQGNGDIADFRIR